jgi:hypothetical protein
MDTNEAVAATVAETSLADDLLRGVKPIAEFLGENERRTFYLCERGYIPAGKCGSQWIASKRALRVHFDRITRADSDHLGRPDSAAAVRPRVRRSPFPVRGGGHV